MRILYKAFHLVKDYLIKKRPPILTWLFFSLLPAMEHLVSARKEGRLTKLKRDLFRQLYFSKYSRSHPPFVLKATNTLAINSDDHKWPHGTLHDNSSNKLFNLKLYDLMGHKQDLHLLDLGCSGGAFVRSILEDGYTSVGLEGSDVSKKLSTGEWGTIPLHLFTCDITKDFGLFDSTGTAVQFDVITAWEVLEHIPKIALENLGRNIVNNLKPGGYFIASVAIFRDENPLIGAVYHVTLEDKSWWISQFSALGFTEVTHHRFVTQDWIRGNGKGLTNWSPEDGNYGFHLILRKAAI